MFSCPNSPSVILTVLESTLKPKWWNKLVWEDCHHWPSEMLLSAGSSAVQDPLCLFFMLVLQLCFKNATYEPESPFSFKDTSAVWWSGFPSFLGLVVSLSSLKRRNWWSLEMPECVGQRLTSAWLWGVCEHLYVHVCIRMRSGRKNRGRRALSRSRSKKELIWDESLKWCRFCKWPRASVCSYAVHDFPRGSWALLYTWVCKDCYSPAWTLP